MDGAHLHQISLENFRSIDRKVEVRLDAPVVIIHGQNGVGKTSLLSAIELALTGAIPSMERADPDYKKQLLHQGTAVGNVVLRLTDVEAITQPLEVKITSEDVTASARLSEKPRKFFSERCYLPQSALTQLLTIYQESDSRVDSLLSRFVSELLGLDRLDALEIGLEPIRDLRNARKIAKSYDDVDREAKRLDGELERARSQLIEVEGALAISRAGLEAAIAALGLRMPGDDTARSELERELGYSSEEPDLVDLADKSRQLTVLRRAAVRQAQISGMNPSASELVFRTAQEEVDAWRKRYLGDIDAALVNLRDYSTIAEREALDDPGKVIETAIGFLAEDLQRLENVDARLQAGNRRQLEIEDAVKRNQSRTASLDEQIATIAVETSPLSVLLSELFSHIHGEECPVCGRDYREVSTEPLTSRVAKRVAELSDQAARLRALTTERSELSADLASLAQERETIETQARREGPPLEVQDRAAKIRNLLARLRELLSAAVEGSRLLSAEMHARQAVAQIRNASSAERDLRSSLAEHADFLGLSPPAPTEDTDAVLDRLEAALNEREERLKAHLQARSIAVEKLRKIYDHSRQADTWRQRIQQFEQDEARVRNAYNAAERIRGGVRQILTAAANTRAVIVRQVFNEQLNSLWRDLFVRLAPMEAYVPFFEVPENPTRRLVPIIRTRHRSGATGGTPAAMLSAGNVNTAALTLFLALHLSVPPQLPWLILDDPVQSMDEVHIAQFAALLRTLSKEHRRQVIIAVHDRPLFDYLCLELSPAFAGDELITIELAKTGDNHSWVNSNRRAFEPETAVKPLAA
jgi:exonuclease SbcC